jgi:AcrR family transcriptional regulator
LEASRKNIAEFIGITPALISYYFPERAELFEAATVPVIEKYLFALAEFEEKGLNGHGVLRQLISVFVECNTVDFRIFESFKTIVLESQSYAGPDLVELLLEGAQSLFNGQFLGDDDVSFDPRFVVNSLWGICRFSSAWSTTGQISSTLPAAPAVSNAISAELIYALLTHKVRPSPPKHRHAVEGLARHPMKTARTLSTIVPFTA